MLCLNSLFSRVVGQVTNRDFQPYTHWSRCGFLRQCHAVWLLVLLFKIWNQQLWVLPFCLFSFVSSLCKMAVGNLIGLWFSSIVIFFWGKGKGFIWVVGHSLSSGGGQGRKWSRDPEHTVRPGSCCAIFLTQPRPAQPGTTTPSGESSNKWTWVSSCSFGSFLNIALFHSFQFMNLVFRQIYSSGWTFVHMAAILCPFPQFLNFVLEADCFLCKCQVHYWELHGARVTQDCGTEEPSTCLSPAATGNPESFLLLSEVLLCGVSTVAGLTFLLFH